MAVCRAQAYDIDKVTSREILWYSYIIWVALNIKQL